MLDKLTLLPEQSQAVDAIINEPSGAALVGSDLGTGKTVVAVEAALGLASDGVVLVSAPLHTRYGWFDTLERQTRGEKSFRWVNNKTKAGREAFADLQWGVSGFYFIGREFFRLQDWSKQHVDVMVHDECHTLQNRNAKGFKAAKKIKAGFTIAQSATWFGSSFEGAWAIARVLWPSLSEQHAVADKYFWRWVYYWCETEYDYFAPNNKRIKGEKNPGEFAKAVPLYINLRSKLGDVVVTDVYVDLSRSQRKMYDQMEADAVAWLRDNPLVAEFPITQRIRLRQMTLAEASLDGEGVVHFAADAKSSKIDALVDMLNDFGDEKVLIATDSAKFANIVADRVGGFAWTGGKTQMEREQAKTDFVTGGLKYIVATHAAISEGVDGLQHASHILVELSAHDSPVLNKQLLGRLNRHGQQKAVLVYRVLARDTLDDPQAETLLVKELKLRESTLKNGGLNGNSEG
jgi:superfamily II DNA or RNA helicase